MKNFSLRPKVWFQGDVSLPDYLQTSDAIANEPMLFSCSPEVAKAIGGPITRHVVDAIMGYVPQNLPDHSPYVVIDTKSVMLMPGQTPCIPGWHCDAVHREGELFQPVLSEARQDRYHWTVCVPDDAGNLSETEFLLPNGDELYGTYDPNRTWGSFNEGIVAGLKSPAEVVAIPACEIVRFNSHAPHRGQPATRTGWRWWIRLSMYPRPPKNARRHQVQVYASENLGW